MICAHCGKQNPEGAKFCGFCGSTSPRGTPGAQARKKPKDSLPYLIAAIAAGGAHMALFAMCAERKTLTDLSLTHATGRAYRRRRAVCANHGACARYARITTRRRIECVKNEKFVQSARNESPRWAKPQFACTLSRSRRAAMWRRVRMCPAWLPKAGALQRP
ncbi:MAG: zinc ribbon domain-containing protein [Terriglobia bacterium]